MTGGRVMILGGAAVGVLALGLSALLADGHDFLRTYLTSFVFWLSISLGALFFVILQHLTRSGWSVVVRRIAEALSANLLLLAAGFIPVILSLEQLFEWTHPEGDPLLEKKAAYLNPTFFTIRVAAYFGVWALLSRFYLRNSVRQDESGDPSLTSRMESRSPVALILYAVTVTFASFDIVMSLDPHWFSTIFGVYFFSGAVVSLFATLAVATFLLDRPGGLGGAVTVEHYHDIGKQLFGYVTFWAYIAFCQFLLIWYANIPEETSWYLTRSTGGWTAVSYALLFGHFVLPFVVLLPRAVKRRPALLAVIAAWVLAMHWMDIFWLTAPEKGSGHVPFSLLDVTVFVGTGALYVAATAFTLSRVSLIPAKDPRLPESLAFENQ